MTQIKLNKKELEQSIAFYKGQGIQDVLKRFEFTKDEQKKIDNAIRTSKLPNPRVKLICEVNELLKKIAKTRKPKQSKTEIEIETSIEWNLKMASLESKKEEIVLKKDSFKIKIGIIVFILSILFQSYIEEKNDERIKKYMIQEQQQYEKSVVF